MKAGGVGCADNRCQNNKPNKFGLNGKWRQVFCNREQENGKWFGKNRESKQVVNWNGKGKKQENESLPKEKKQGYMK